MVLKEIEPSWGTSDVLPPLQLLSDLSHTGGGTEGQLSRGMTCTSVRKTVPKDDVVTGWGIRARAQPPHPPDPPEPRLQPELPFGLPALSVYLFIFFLLDTVQ